jgi:glycerol kinase
MTKNEQYILALDQGTTSSRAFVYDLECRGDSLEHLENAQL